MIQREAESTCPCFISQFITSGQAGEATDGPGMAHNVMASLSKAVPLASVRDKAPIRKHNYAETKTSQGRSLRLAQEFWAEIMYGAPSTGWAGHIHKDWSPVTTIFPHIDSRRAEISD